MCCEWKAGKQEIMKAGNQIRWTAYDTLCRTTSSDRFQAHHSRGHNFRGRKGFSLIEVMVVVVIIALLASIVGINVKSYRDKASQKKARADIAVLVTAVKSFYADNGRYPTANEGLAVLAPEYVDQVSLDPWGNAYQFEVPGSEGAFDIISFGADGAEGGEGIDQDLTNWNANGETKP